MRPISTGKALIQRFLVQVLFHPKGCWIWTGSTAGKTKYPHLRYGYFTVGGRKGKYDRAHRFAYKQWVGAIPAGLELDHTCRRPLCVNPLHLEAVTSTENRRRSVAAKTHCVHGHEYTEENTYINKHNEVLDRRCRKCQNIRYQKMAKTS